uniref:NADH dehydrogenase subunit 4L n=1 Tax=Laemobothrion atrum TaxID=179170 RepID=UPI00257A55CB|nr:NADH dehydrogenase subunit 4L [Laemobothrion atrum]WGU50361.1 NADH dehydrogenase subunit 4L [Laemobothrion atrum]
MIVSLMASVSAFLKLSLSKGMITMFLSMELLMISCVVMLILSVETSLISTLSFLVIMVLESIYAISIVISITRSLGSEAVDSFSHAF